jgi:ankyrin repeat protein
VAPHRTQNALCAGEHNNTAAQWAARKGEAECVELLVAHGADTTKKDSVGGSRSRSHTRFEFS